MKLSSFKTRTFRLTCFLVCAILALCFQALVPISSVVSADEAMIEIQSDVGFGASNVKQGRWTPVTMTLHNQGADLSGDLVVQVANPNRSKDFSYVEHVELPKGSTKVVTMRLPGYAYTKSNNTIALYEKSLKNGNKKTLDGKTYLEAFPLPKETLQVGVLARDVDTLNFLSLLGQSGKKLNVLHLKQTDIPREALGLDGLDVLALNDFASDTLTGEQVQAILQWTKRGGTLLLAGGAGYPKTAAPFAEASPVTYQGTTTVKELPELAKAGEKELILTQPLTLSQAKLVKGAESVVVTDGALPIYARGTYGSGFVTYVAYDLSLNPLASWNGNARLWEQMLSGPLESANAFNLNQMRYGNDPYYELDRALEYFPSLQPPKLPILAIVLLIYAIVVGPLLYMILRRLDRREWAWFVIPVAAIVTSIGIFQFGASNRGSTMAQTFNTITLNGSGSGIKQSTLSVFLPKGGSMELKFPGKAAVSPFMQGEVYPSLQLHDRSELVIRQEQESAIVGLQDIPYSSISKLAMDEERPVQLGRLDYSISELSAKGAKGQITNNTKNNLTDVAVLVNQTFIKIGSVKAGASASFDTANGFGISNGPDVAQLAYPLPSTNGYDTGLHQRSMLSAYLHRKVRISGGLNPLIIGWLKEQTPLNLSSNGSIPAEQLTLIAQDMKIDYVTPDGKIMIPSTTMVPELIDNHLKMSSIEFRNGPFMQMGSGDVTLNYQLPFIAGASYQTMEMTGDPNPDVTLDLWNSQTKAWEPLTLKSFQSWEGDKLQPYLLEGKSIRMKVTTVQNHSMFRIPAVSLEGSVKR
ncbi:hypothetical protein [Paenibacillus alginolyticus]|uniref:Uncharacterized protein n=1 Tax=Paenibacillus alginolyticus TaxID=59839 RepID=A0ABT4GCA7_9BACL|nr:hypothetical protein [Paenibacillus alginolyticus]MCY9693821.1 hypothetical protein [Paenibacillus alginolyticus]MEC0148768.1 hypothetical protein [Paenibacillus alginolyticus]